MNSRSTFTLMLVSTATLIGQADRAAAQCCLTDFFASLGSCCRTAPPPPPVAVAPVMAQPIVAPVAAPVVAAPVPPQPVMVPMQQVSYVPETCYRTEYQCVPVTCCRPIQEIDPCTGCVTECMQQETNYVQKAVNVPYTQYRAVYTTKYVQVQPGATSAVAATGTAGAGSSPFAAPVQTPQAWGAAGADVPQQLAPQQSFQQQILPQGAVSGQTYAPQTVQQPVYQQPLSSQPATATGAGTQTVPQPTAPPTLSPVPQVTQPALRPIPEQPASKAASSSAPAASSAPGQVGAPTSGSAAGIPGLLDPAGKTTARGDSPVGSGDPRAMLSLIPLPSAASTPTSTAGLGVASRSYPTAAIPSRLD